MRRAVASLIVAVLTSSALVPLTCSGWEAAAADRMACCQRAGHDCPDQAAADACCAQQEETRQPAMTLSASAVTAPSALVAVILSALDLSSIGSAVSRHYQSVAAPQLHAPPGSFQRPLRV